MMKKNLQKNHSPASLFLSVAVILFVASCNNASIKKTSDETQTPGLSSSQTKPNTAHQALRAGDQSAFKEALRLLAMNDFNKSEKILKKLAKKYPYHAPTRANLANLSFQKKDLNSAYMHAKSLYTIAPETGYGQMILGLIAVEQSSFIEAEKYYLQAIEANAGFADAHYNLAVLYDVHYNKRKKAYTHYQQYLSLIPTGDVDITRRLKELESSLFRD